MLRIVGLIFLTFMIGAPTSAEQWREHNNLSANYATNSNGNTEQGVPSSVINFKSYSPSNVGGDNKQQAGWFGIPFEGWVAIFTFFLVVSTIGLWVQTRSSVRIARRALTDLERPYLFILDYNWLVIDPTKTGGLEPGWVYFVTNAGKLPAIIKAVKMGITIGGHTPAALVDEPPIHDLLTAPLIGA